MIVAYSSNAHRYYYRKYFEIIIGLFGLISIFLLRTRLIHKHVIHSKNDGSQHFPILLHKMSTTKTFPLNVTQAIYDNFKGNVSKYNYLSKQIEKLKLPSKYMIKKNEENQSIAMFNNKLYETEGIFFEDFLHYLDPWKKWKQHLSNKNIKLTSKWTDAKNNHTQVRTKNKKQPLSQKYLTYQIINYPIKPLFLRSNKQRVC